DGRDVARSVMRLPWGPNDIVAAAEWWNDYVWVGRRVGAVLGKGRYAEVRFEDLVQDSEGQLRRLCAFLGEDFAPEMLDYHKDAATSIPSGRKSQHYNADAPPNAARAYSWKREMAACEVAIFDRYAGRMLAEVGYERPEVRASAARIHWNLAKIYARRLMTPP